MREWSPHRIMMPGRIAALLLLALALWQPGPAGRDDAMIAVLVDHSTSMSPNAIDAAKERLARDLGPLNDKIELNAMRFGDPLPDDPLIDRLQEALWTMRPNTVNSIVIASDGYWSATVEPLLQRMADGGLPVYWLPAAAAQGVPRIIDIAAPTDARAGQNIAVSVAAALPDEGNFDIVLFGDRSPVARASANRRAGTILQFSLPDAGVVTLSAELISTTSGESVARLDDSALVNIISPPNLLLVSSDASPLGDSLAAGGWPLTRVSPSQFPALTSNLGRFDALVLDDVPASSLPEPSWRAVSEAVRRDALGLLVLGGPHSFALGAYRGSSLEDLLPLISEPPESEQPASVEFLVDISGSMGRGDAGILRLAREAVLETVSALRNVDRTGLVAFDVNARQLLPIASRKDHVEAIRQAWPDRAAGGTSLVPALDLGLAALENESSEQKLLMVITDGMLADEDVSNLEQRLQDSDVFFVAMVVRPGSASQRFTRIAASERATILHIDDVLQLPQLMRAELETRRPALVRGRTVPVLRSPVPFANADNDWPVFDAYLVTRPRPEATVMLGSTAGDPLLAAWTAGAGRVVTVTGGLGQWAGDWIGWENWPDFTADLAGFVAVRNAAQVRLRQSRRFVDIDTARSADMPGNALLLQPADTAIEVDAVPVAPRRYQITTPLSQPGRHSLIWESDAKMNRYSFINPLAGEPSVIGDPVAREFVAAGLLQGWTADSAAALAPQPSRKSKLMLLALIMFLLTIAAERVPLRIQKR